ncbi:hypothetical protein [Sideroxydans sp. CL21]|uniref:hypothetical protein n=1 Tax=Sideroxydans sp. CL21 TaxID=2600596 RepID=UPI0024BC1D96|nr:hypothetical protein [Sideroxydans sp. CL21]
MKKIVLSLAGVMAAVAFAPEASALPAFARQTGMACSACHFQHFPALNSFGRAFKSGGFTMVGAQGKIEGDRLSIPDTLNMNFLASMGYVKTNQNPNLSGVTKNAGNGGFYLPGIAGEASLFVGGRVSDYAGWLSEITLSGAAAIDSGKLAILPEIGSSGIHAGMVPFATNGQGASYGFEYLNTGANAIHSITNTVGNALGSAPLGQKSEFINAVSAQQYIGTATGADGVAAVVNSDMGFVNITKFNMSGMATGQQATLGSTYLRVAGLFDLAGWDSALGFQNWSGSSLNDGSNVNPAAATSAIMMQSKAWAIDGQMQGTLGDMPTGFYFSYARAPAAATNEAPNAFNGGTLTRSSFNIDAEIGVIPEVATIGAAIRRASSGVADASNNNMSDNAIYLTATYKFAQNMLARLSWVDQTGSYWNAVSTNLNPNPTNLTNTQVSGSKVTAINMYVLF